MAHKDLVIINNEKISKKNNNFYCDNVDMQSIPEDLNKNFNVNVIARKSKVERACKIDLEKIEVASNIFLFLFYILKTFKKNKAVYLIISITPYTFLSYLLLFFFNKKVFIYLRSDGYEEYKAIMGFWGPPIYHIMFKISTFKSNIISCQERLFKKRKRDIVFPSEITPLWLENIKKPLLDKPKLLYVGRVKVEKGIFSLLKIFNESNIESELSIVGKIDNHKKNNSLFDNKKIFYLGHGLAASRLIDIYDNSNIFVLPSFTEAHPKVLDESLARMRPVIIFEEIEHVIQNRIGIFVSKRDIKSFEKVVNFIIQNYEKIQENMKSNKLPTRKDFITKMSNILGSN